MILQNICGHDVFQSLINYDSVSVLQGLEAHQSNQQDCFFDDVVQTQIDFLTLANAGDLIGELTADAQTKDSSAIANHN